MASDAPAGAASTAGTRPWKDDEVTAPDAATHVDDETPTRLPATGIDPGPLDRRVDIGRLGWFGILAAVALVAAAAMRFTKLDAYALTVREGDLAYSAWSLFTGRPFPTGEELPSVAPLFHLLQAVTFFLFGETDAIARSLAALTGLGLVILLFAFRPVLPRTSVLGMALLVAVSPTLVYASRTVDPSILVGFFALVAVLSIARAGAAPASNVRAWAALLGLALAAMVASGPKGVTTIIALGIAVAVAALSESRPGADGERQGPVSAGIGAIIGSTTALATLAASFVVFSLLAFSRLLTDASALQGFLTTFSDWGRLMASQPSATPTQFFFYATLLYEFLAVVLAIVALTSSPRAAADEPAAPELQPALFATWFLATLVLHSLASGRQPDQIALVTLPLVLLGGFGLGRLLERIPWRRLWTTNIGLLPLAMFALVIGLAGLVTLIARSNDPQLAGQPASVVGILGVFALVVVPLALLVFRESQRATVTRYAAWSGLLVVTVLLGLATIRTTTQLAWERADTGVELVAQRVPTSGTKSFIDQTYRLSRDLSLTEVSAIDNTGSFGISIAIDPAIEWPFYWYFREFPDVRVTTPAGWNDADMVIAPSAENMQDEGYVVQSRAWMNRVPAPYEDLSLGTIVSAVLSPSQWYDSFRFLLFRDLTNPPVAEQMSVGYTFRLSNQMNPAAGPFDLTTGQSLGPGAALGQLRAPTGIALSTDGQVIYIVDSGNRRIQRFTRDGQFIGAWTAETDPRLALGLFDQAGQGASDILVGPDGLIYVADTWNHRVMVLDANGQIVRELGRPGEATNTGDSPDPTLEPGLFYGPRGVAIANGELYVTDTGNERVQVFAPDGTFLRAFGGWGSEPGKLIEPVGIAIGPDGNVYVADTGNARISVFTADGQPVTQLQVPGWEGTFGQQTFLRFGPDGVLFITSPGTGQVLAWNGAEFAPVRGAGVPGDDLIEPVGMTITADGVMMVTETSESHVYEFPIQLPEGFASGAGATPGLEATPQVTAAAEVDEAAPEATPGGAPAVG